MLKFVLNQDVFKLFRIYLQDSLNGWAMYLQKHQLPLRWNGAIKWTAVKAQSLET